MPAQVHHGYADGARPLSRWEIASAYMHVVENMQAEFAITLVSNRSAGESTFADVLRLKREVREFHARLDRQILRRSWSKQAPECRTDGIWIPENLGSNPHVHGALRMPVFARNVVTASELEPLLQKIYSTLAPAGSLVLKAIDPYWFGYMAKKLRHPDDIWLGQALAM